MSVGVSHSWWFWSSWFNFSFLYGILQFLSIIHTRFAFHTFGEAAVAAPFIASYKRVTIRSIAVLSSSAALFSSSTRRRLQESSTSGLLRSAIGPTSYVMTASDLHAHDPVNKIKKYADNNNNIDETFIQRHKSVDAESVDTCITLVRMKFNMSRTGLWRTI